MAYGTLKADSIVYDNSGSDVSVTVSNIPTAASPTFTGNVTINAQGDLRLADSDSSNYVGFQAPATVSSNLLYTLPGADGSAGEQLTTDGSGTLSWSAAVNVAAASLTGTTIAANVVTSSLTTVGTLGGLTIDGDVTFTGASSNGLWDKSANQFVANLSGTASLATEFTVSANNSTDETCYPLFVDAATGSQGAESDTGFTYNPSSGALTATSFVGTASVATNVTVADESSDTTCFPLFTTGATGDLAPKSGSNLTFNSSSGTLAATVIQAETFRGEGTSASNALQWSKSNQKLTLDDGVKIGLGSSGSDCELYHDGTDTYITNSTGSLKISAISGTSTISDDKGNVRSVPTRNETNAYTLVASDAGKCITADNGVTVPNGVFAAGDVITIINSATSDKTITQGSSLTMRNVGDDGNTGNVSVKKYAMCTLIFTSSSVCFFSTTAKA